MCLINLSHGILDGEGSAVVLIRDGDPLMVLVVRGLLLTPPGLGGDWLTDDVSGPGVRPSYLDGGDPEVVPDNPRLDWKNKGSDLKPGRWWCSGHRVFPHDDMVMGSNPAPAAGKSKTSFHVMMTKDNSTRVT